MQTQNNTHTHEHVCIKFMQYQTKQLSLAFATMYALSVVTLELATLGKS